MLTIPIDRITRLLEQASQIWTFPEYDTGGNVAAALAARAGSDLEQALADTAAYRELAAMLNELTPVEVRELLTVAAIGAADESNDESWALTLRDARVASTEEALSRLARLLVLTDAVENGLGRLGYIDDLDDKDFDDDDFDDRNDAAEEDDIEETSLHSGSGTRH